MESPLSLSPNSASRGAGSAARAGWVSLAPSAHPFIPSRRHPPAPPAPARAAGFDPHAAPGDEVRLPGGVDNPNLPESPAGAQPQRTLHSYGPGRGEVRHRPVYGVAALGAAEIGDCPASSASSSRGLEIGDCPAGSDYAKQERKRCTYLGPAASHDYGPTSDAFSPRSRWTTGKPRPPLRDRGRSCQSALSGTAHPRTVPAIPATTPRLRPPLSLPSPGSKSAIQQTAAIKVNTATTARTATGRRIMRNRAAASSITGTTIPRKNRAKSLSTPSRPQESGATGQRFNSWDRYSPGKPRRHELSALPVRKGHAWYHSRRWTLAANYPRANAILPPRSLGSDPSHAQGVRARSGYGAISHFWSRCCPAAMWLPSEINAAAPVRRRRVSTCF